MKWPFQVGDRITASWNRDEVGRVVRLFQVGERPAMDVEWGSHRTINKLGYFCDLHGIFKLHREPTTFERDLQDYIDATKRELGL